MSTAAERLRKARIDAGYSSAKLAAEACGLVAPTLYHHENGTRKMDSRMAEIYAGAFDVDPAWLLLGEPRRVSLEEEWQETAVAAADVHQAYSRENYRPKVPGAVPEIDVEAGAGDGRVGEVISLPIGSETYSGHKIVDEWLVPEAYFDRVLDARSGTTLVMAVVGDSMQPTYAPGDRVFVDLTQNRLTTDTVYVISDGFSPPQIKRLQRVLFSKPAEVEVISDNTSHKSQRVTLDELRIIGRVIGAVTKR